MAKAKRKTCEIRTLRELRQLFASDLNPVLVGIDFEGTNSIISGFQHRANAQAGLAILDTCHLSLLYTSSLSICNLYSQSISLQSIPTPSSSSPCTSAQSTPPVFNTFNFIIGSNKYFEQSSAKALWGTSERIAKSEILFKIEDCIPKNRIIILIGHGIQAAISVLDALGFNFEKIHSIFDTYQLAQETGLGECSLQNLLAKLGHPSPSEQFHTAGNDATFTLRAFILILVRDLETCGVSTPPIHHNLQHMGQKCFGILEDAVILPDKTNKWSRAKPIMIHGVEMITVPPKRKGEEVSIYDSMPKIKIGDPPKRFLAKSWTAEMQDSIRNERRQRAFIRERDGGMFGVGPSLDRYVENCSTSTSP